MCDVDAHGERLRTMPGEGSPTLHSLGRGAFRSSYTGWPEPWPLSVGARALRPGIRLRADQGSARAQTRPIRLAQMQTASLRLQRATFAKPAPVGSGSKSTISRPRTRALSSSIARTAVSCLVLDREFEPVHLIIPDEIKSLEVVDSLWIGSGTPILTCVADR